MIRRVFLFFVVSYVRALTKVGNKSIVSCVNEGLPHAPLSSISPTLRTNFEYNFLNEIKVCAKWDGFIRPCNSGRPSILRLWIKSAEGSAKKIEAFFDTKQAIDNSYCQVFNVSTIANSTRDMDLEDSLFGADAVVHGKWEKGEDKENAKVKRAVALENISVGNYPGSDQDDGIVDQVTRRRDIESLIENEKLKTIEEASALELHARKKLIHAKNRKIALLANIERHAKNGERLGIMGFADISRLAKDARDFEILNEDTDEIKDQIARIAEIGRLAATRDVSSYVNQLVELHAEAMMADSKAQYSRLFTIKSFSRAENDTELVILVNDAVNGEKTRDYANEFRHGADERQLETLETFMQMVRSWYFKLLGVSLKRVSHATEMSRVEQEADDQKKMVADIASTAAAVKSRKSGEEGGAAKYADDINTLTRIEELVKTLQDSMVDSHPWYVDFPQELLTLASHSLDATLAQKVIEANDGMRSVNEERARRWQSVQYADQAAFLAEDSERRKMDTIYWGRENVLKEYDRIEEILASIKRQDKVARTMKSDIKAARAEISKLDKVAKIVESAKIESAQDTKRTFEVSVFSESSFSGHGKQPATEGSSLRTNVICAFPGCENSTKRKVKNVLVKQFHGSNGAIPSLGFHLIIQSVCLVAILIL